MIKVCKSDPAAINQLSETLRERVDAFYHAFAEPFVKSSLAGDLGTDAQMTMSLCIDASARADRFPSSTQLMNSLNAFSGRSSDVSGIKKALEQTFPRMDPFVLASVALEYANNVDAGHDCGCRHARLALQMNLGRRVALQAAHFMLASYLLARILRDHGVVHLFDLRDSLNPSAPSVVQDWWKVSRLYSNMTTRTEIFHEFEWIFTPFAVASHSESIAAHQSGLERWCQATTEALGPDVYDLSELEADAWADVYQRYLGPSERQRLGGFYTPPSLVDLLLAAVKYDPDVDGTYDWTVLDPTCGSGSFLVGCALKLVKAVRRRESTPTAVIETYCQRLVANDVHRFATFLTGVNLLVPLLPEIAACRLRDVKFKVPLRVFAEDFLRLLGPSTQSEGLASLRGKVDLVVGNPPWGGVLKGWQGPLYDASERRELRASFGVLWKDKVDVFVLFLVRALDFLPSGGKISFLVQSTLLDKRFGIEVRRLLTREYTPSFIVDLSGQGGTYFQTYEGGVSPGKSGSKKSVMNVPMGIGLLKGAVADGTMRVIVTRNSLTKAEVRADQFRRMHAFITAQVDSGLAPVSRFTSIRTFYLA